MPYTTIKKLGNSYGIILPREYVRKKNLVENEVVEVEIHKKNENLKSLFGTLKFDKSTQEIKDELKKGWE